jgi:AhpD family alkylhydroperoxidase
MTTDHPARYRHLEGRMVALGSELPDVMSAFSRLHSAAVAGGALDVRTKELIALAISICVHCDGCIAYHVHDAVEAGAERAQILEAIGVAVMMGGGPATVYAAQAHEALEEFTAG